jgi:hypothetical protein
VNWELWWPSFPVLVYFKETQTKPEGQIHFFPVIFVSTKETKSDILFSVVVQLYPATSFECLKDQDHRVLSILSRFAGNLGSFINVEWEGIR